jgi:hypothetical protein
LEGSLLEAKIGAQPLVKTLASNREKDTHLRVTKKEAPIAAPSM